MVPKEIKEQILAQLAERLKLYRVILFGSHAGGSPDVDSDVDLLVVTDDDFTPANFEENMQNYLKVSSALRDIKRKIPIDLIVHTKPMHERFIRLGSMFSREIAEKGEVLYERGN
jgi:predicted nucleotidyltransferase